MGKAEMGMRNDYIPLEEAARRSGLHPNTLRRRRREGVIHGYKAGGGGKRHWLVSATSLKIYTDPVLGFLLDLPGPKIFLKKKGQSQRRRSPAM
jgi:hypothetical protein